MTDAERGESRVRPGIGKAPGALHREGGREARGPARVLMLALSALAIFLAGSLWLALFPPVPVDLDGAPNLDSRATRERVPVGEDHLDAWVLRGGGRGLVVIFHGYGRNHTRAWRYAQFLNRAGYSVVAPDFRSSRETDRKPTTLGRYELDDAEAVLRWVESSRYSKEPLALLGESLGGSVALVLAARHAEVRAVVADCPFASGRRALEDTFHYWTLLPGGPVATVAGAVGGVVTGADLTALDVVAAADSLRATPLFLIHAARDDRMRPGQAEAIRAAAGGKDELWLTPEGHTEGWKFHREEYERRVLSFLAHALRPAPGARAKDAAVAPRGDARAVTRAAPRAVPRAAH